MPGLQLHRIATPAASAAEVAALREVIFAAPAYSQVVAGRAPSSEDVSSLLQDLPPGFTHDDKFLFGLWQDGNLIGCMDVLRGWKRPGQAMIGLLLLREDAQGCGHGRAAFAALKEMAGDWGLDSLRIGVVATNEGALAFWRRMGFAETGERVQLPDYLAETIILEQPLR